jgi:hypothetical protein
MMGRLFLFLGTIDMESKRWRLKSLRTWLTGIDRVIACVEAYRATGRWEPSLELLLESFAALETEAERLFGKWEVDRSEASLKLTGRASSPTQLQSELLDLFEHLREVGRFASQLLEGDRVPGTQLSLITSHESLRTALEAVDSGPDLTTADVSWLRCCTPRNVRSRTRSGALKKLPAMRRTRSGRSPRLKFRRSDFFGARAQEAPKPKWGQKWRQRVEP